MRRLANVLLAAWLAAACSALNVDVSPSPSPLPSPTGLLDGVNSAAVAFAFQRPAQELGESDEYALHYGRLGGAVFRFEAPTPIRSARPALDGRVIAWWWDPDAQETVVALFDTATGHRVDLLRTAAHVFDAAVSPAADRWYWIPAAGPRHAEPPFGDSDGLWAGAVEGDTQERIADLGGDAGYIRVSLDGAAVLVTSPEPTTDFGSARVWVWMNDDSSLIDFGTIDEIPVGLLGDEIIVDGTFAGQAGLSAISLEDGSRRTVLRPGTEFDAPEIVRAADGAGMLVFLGPSPDGRHALLGLERGQPQPRVVYRTDHAWLSDEAPLLLRSGSSGGIDLPGWVVLSSFASPLARQAFMDESGPSWLVNLASGAVVRIPRPALSSPSD